MKRSVLLNSTSAQGKKLQKSFTDVNPEASGQSLKTFAQKVNGLTTATYNSTDMVDKYNLDTETPPNPPTEPTLSLTKNAWDVKTDHNDGDFAFHTTVTYNGDGDVYIEITENVTDYSGYITYDNGDIIMHILQTKTSGTVTQTLKLKSTATDNYKAAEFTFTVTGNNL